MGHAGSVATDSVRCCQQEGVSPDWADELRRGEVDWQGEHYSGISNGYAAPDQPLVESVPCMPDARGFACCQEQTLAASGPVPLQPLESLSYTPFRFDEGHTVDVERSHQRYSKILLHSNRAKTQKRSKAWGDWVSSVTARPAVAQIGRAHV